jgi:hypothetical protein
VRHAYRRTSLDGKLHKSVQGIGLAGSGRERQADLLGAIGVACLDRMFDDGDEEPATVIDAVKDADDLHGAIEVAYRQDALTTWCAIRMAELEGPMRLARGRV